MSGPNIKECREQQFDIEKRQLNRALEQQIAVRDGTGRDGEIKQREEI
jgi:hypothetical protein